VEGAEVVNGVINRFKKCALKVSVSGIKPKGQATISN
jgi:hypothetical protein